ncbi:putative Ig domain-containing protein [Sulfurimonas sp. SAG-AH-194-L11]|nr:Ig domain-containing protein [Sulfurimonas sp. SAG-AH-194-L11]MDF1877882.1 putative Ig domain-containing protein [Sulfurimonas sp. SAG-AH-194-L11]
MPTLILKFLTIFGLFFFFQSNALAASYQCPGEDVLEVNGAISSANKSYSENTTNENKRYFKFSTATAGSITISFNGTNQDQRMRIATICDQKNIYDPSDSTKKSDSYTFNVDSGETYYVYMEEKNHNNRLKFTITFDFIVLVDSPPVIDTIPDQQTPPDTSYSLDLSTYVTLTNADPILSYTLIGTLPTGLSFNTSTGVISGIPTVLESQTLTLSATDKDGESNIKSFLIRVSQETNYTLGIRPFELINPLETQNIIGNTQIIGNTVQCVTTTTVWDQTTTDYSNLSCTTNIDATNNSYIVKHLDIDSNTSTFNSTSATLQFPSTYKEIVWAGLFWQGNLNNGSLTSYVDNYNYTFANDLPTQDIKDTKANEVQLQIGNSPYQLVSAQQLDYRAEVADIANYSSFANITKYFGTYSPGTTLEITLANLLTSEGQLYVNGSGTYGAWSLVIIYAEDSSNTNSKLRNNSIYSGYLYLSSSTSGDNPIDITGLLLPKRGTINSEMSVFSAEGEHLYTTDSISLDGNKLGGAQQDNIFDGQVSSNLIRNPNFDNTNGIDIDVFDTSAILTDKRDADPTALTYAVQITLQTNNDVYYPSMVSFTTELYKPRVCYYIDTIVNSAGNDIFANGAFVSGQSINNNEEYTFNFWISNMKKNLLDTDVEIANKVQIYLNQTNFNYTAASTNILNIGTTSYVNISDRYNADNNLSNDPDDLGDYTNNISTWRVGSGASNLAGGQLDVANGFSDTDKIVKVNLKGSISISDSTQEIDLLNYLEFKASFQTDSITIGADNAQLIVQCQDLNTSGSVGGALGAFNVVNENGGTADFSDQTSAQTYLVTQVAGRQFTVKLISLNNTKDALSLYNGDINVTLIQTPNYDSCVDDTCKQTLCNEAVDLSLPQIITLDNNSSTNFPVTHNQAMQNVSFRMSYDNGAGEQKTCSVDSFAIRPDKFTLSLAGTDIELLHSAIPYNFTLIGEDFLNTPTVGYTILNARSMLNSTLDTNKTIYNPDGTDGTATLNGTLTLGATDFDIIDGRSISKTSTDTDVVSVSFDDVGRVNLLFQDINWSKVDIDNGDTVADCSATGAYICGDINVTFIPDHFALSGAQLLNYNSATYTYLSNDLNVSAGMDLTITAQNDNNDTTLNFTSTSWENPVNITYTLPNVTDTSLSENISDANNSLLLNFTNGVKTINSTDTNASINLIFNYSRSVSNAVNPFSIDGANINIIASSIYISGTGTLDTINGATTAAQTATFIYGRTHAPRQRFKGNSGDALIYYEAYCSGTINGNVCDKTLLPGGVNSNSTDDPRWFINPVHIVSSGTVGTITQKSGAGDITVGVATGVSAVTVPLTYTETKGYPFKTTMENNASLWLLYDKYDAGANTNEFEVEFINSNDTWAGKKETDKTTIKRATDITNRRSMW